MRLRVLIPALLLVVSFWSIQMHSAMPLSADQQGTYQITVLNATLTINYNQSTYFEVTVFQDSNPINNSYFYFPDITFDIGETQSYKGNGLYQINISQSMSRDVPAGSYETILTASIGDTSIDTVVSLEVLNPDAIAPVLQVNQPLLTDGFNETVFFLEVEGQDENRWRSLEILLGNYSLVYVANINETLNKGGITYNQTHIRWNGWIDLAIARDISDDTLKIILLDEGYNNATLSYDMAGDYISPLLSWVSHQNNDRVYNRTFTIGWTVSDESDIQRQDLYLDNRILEGEIAGTIRELEIFIPIDRDKPGEFTLTLRVVDIFGNQAEQSIFLLYDSSDYAEEPGIIDQIFNPNPNTTENGSLNAILIVGGLVVVISILGFFGINALRSRGTGTTKLSSKARKVLKIDSYQPIIKGLEIPEKETLLEEIKTHLEQIDTSYGFDDAQLRTLKDDVLRICIGHDISVEVYETINDKLNKLFS